MSNRVEKKSEIKTATIISYISIAINILSGLFFTPWLIKQIGDGDYGIYSIATSIITLLIMDFGISEAVAKFVAKYRTEGREDEVNNLIGLVFKIYLLLSVIFLTVFIVFYFFVGNVYKGLSSNEIDKLRQVYIVVAAYNVFAFMFTPLSGIMLAYEHLISLRFSDILIRLTTILVSVFMILAGGGVLAVVIANAVGGIMGIVYKLFVIQRAHRFKVNISYKNKEQLKDIISFSVWIAVMIIAQRCIYSITPSVLGALADSAEVTKFSLASTLEGYVYSFGSAIASLYLARLTRILAENDKNEFNSLLKRTGKIQIILVLLVLVGFICAGDSFIELWLGQGYRDVYFCTILVLLPDVLLWPFMICGTGLTVVGHIKEYALMHVVMAGINVLAEVLLVGAYGAIGAAVGVFIATCVKGVLVVFAYKKYLPMRLGIFVKEVFLRYGLVAILTVMISVAIIRLISQETGNVLTFLYKVTLTALIYGLGVLAMIYTRDPEMQYSIRYVLTRKR